LRRDLLITAAAGIGFAATGLAAAGWLGAVPEAARVITVCVGLILAPAAVALAIISTRIPIRSFVLAYPLSILGTLSVHAIVSEIAWRAGCRLSTYTDVTVWSLLAAYLVAIGVALRARSPRAVGVRRSALAGTFAVVALAAIAVLARPAPAPNEDALDHIGYLRRAVVYDSMRPDGVLAWPEDAPAAPANDPRKGSLHTLLASITVLAGSDPTTTWVWFPAVMFPTAVFAFAAFAMTFAGGAAMLAASMVLFALSYGGTVWQFAPASAYGQNLAATWYWVIAALAVRASIDGLTRARGTALALLCAGGSLVHLGVVAHGFVLAGTLALFGGVAGLPRAARGRVALLIVVFTGLAAAAHLAGKRGTANEIHTHVQGMMQVGKGWMVASPIEVLREHGIVFLGGILLVGWLVPARRTEPRAMLALAFSILPLALAFVPWLATPLFARASYMVLRVLLNAPIIPAIVLVMAWSVQAARRGGGLRRVVTAIAIGWWALVFLDPAAGAFAGDAGRARRAPAHTDPCAAALAEWARGLPAGSTILSDPATSYTLSACTPHRFVALYEQHANPFDPYALDRLRAVRDVLSPFVVGSVAPAACRRYRVDYVVVNRGAGDGATGVLSFWSPGLFDPTVARIESMTASFQRVFVNADAVAFRFLPGGIAQQPAVGPAPPVGVGPRPGPGCDVPVPDDVFGLTGVSVSPARVLPGDSVVVTIGYRRDEPCAFGFPFVIHLRFDHASVPQRRGYPGEKYLRRARERWSGSFVRFRTDVRPGHGVFEPDLWPMGAELCERFVVGVPAAARPGTYRVEVNVERESLLPNFHIDDLLFNRDHYSGTPCAALVVADGVVGSGEHR
jgi:hypothetical protein